ncbi:hypothetical protein M3Y96_01201500 [Aphelenchoides besseyi]|nr:hypothetical protein M3Y96_01201500 [Aphelenchoides besseyi]
MQVDTLNNVDSSRPLSAKSLCLLHVLAGSSSTVSLEAAKFLLDSGQCDVNDREPDDELTPLHVAAAWDNLSMCQLFVHYGANLNAADAEQRSPADIAIGNSRKFLLKLLNRKERRKARKIFKWLRFLFEPHRQRKRNAIPRSASFNCVPIAVPQLTLEEQIDDYLKNATNYNARLSANRFSGLNFKTNDTRMTAAEAIRIINDSNRRESNGRKSSSLGGYLTAAEGPTNQEAFVSYRESEVSAIRPKMSILTSDRSTDLSHEFATPPTSPVPNERPKTPESPEIIPSAPPMTPQITFRTLKAPRHCLTPEVPPTAMPRSASLCAAVKPKDLPQTERISDIAESLITEDETADEEEEPELVELQKKAQSLTMDQLKQRLIRYGHPPGPSLSLTTRKLYERFLGKLEFHALKGVEYEMQRFRLGLKYSIALERLIRSDQRNEQSDIGIVEEALIQNEFKDNPTHDQISFFCYLLIDITELLPNCTFRQFLDAIFYVGKGNRSRPLNHFCDALKHKTAPKGEVSKKIARILSLWEQKMGVVSLHLFNNIHSTEAFIREGAMIEALGVENLTNLKRGEFKGQSKMWPKQRLAEYGAFLLKKAYIIYLNERCRPIFEEDLNGVKL